MTPSNVGTGKMSQAQRSSYLCVGITVSLTFSGSGNHQSSWKNRTDYETCGFGVGDGPWLKSTGYSACQSIVNE